VNSNFGSSFLLVLAIGLTACASEKATAEPAAQASEPDQAASTESDAEVAAEFAIALDGEGLRLVNSETGNTRLLPFGTDRTTTETAVAKQLGAVASRSSNDECGAGPMEFSNFGNFIANFQDDLFVGWDLRDGDKKAALTTMSGVGIGMTRSEMAESVAFDIYEDSTIGTEFHTGGDEPVGFSGLFDGDAPDARITDLWAGTNCIFR
jgi:hypothetical protein